MNSAMDEARPPREGEALDAGALAEYLRGALGENPGELVIDQFPSGYSNLTYLLRLGGHELVLRRPPFGSKVKSAHDMGREFRVLSALHPCYPAAPKPLAYCEDPEVLGAPFYIMERIRGVVPRGKKPAGFHMAPEAIRGACEALAANMAALHALDYRAIGLDALKREGSYVARQVTGWAKRYRDAQTDAIPAVDEAIGWLEANYPADAGAVLVHNDYKFDNTVLDAGDPTKIIGVLDWEMCTIGDPLMDLGATLSYWDEPGDVSTGHLHCFLTIEPGAMTRREYAERYAQESGRDISNLAFYYVFGLIKLAVIVQQIYYRYKQGLTRDPRFANFIIMVGLLGQRAGAVIESGKI